MFRRAFPILAGTLLVACGGGEPDAAPSTDAPTPAVTMSDTPASGSSSDADAIPHALQLTAPLVGGGEIELGEFAGRPVLLWFWAPW